MSDFADFSQLEARLSRSFGTCIAQPCQSALRSSPAWPHQHASSFAHAPVTDSAGMFNQAMLGLGAPAAGAHDGGFAPRTAGFDSLRLSPDEGAVPENVLLAFADDRSLSPEPVSATTKRARNNAVETDDDVNRDGANEAQRCASTQERNRQAQARFRQRQKVRCRASPARSLPRCNSLSGVAKQAARAAPLLVIRAITFRARQGSAELPAIHTAIAATAPLGLQDRVAVLDGQVQKLQEESQRLAEANKELQRRRTLLERSNTHKDEQIQLLNARLNSEPQASKEEVRSQTRPCRLDHTSQTPFIIWLKNVDVVGDPVDLSARARVCVAMGQVPRCNSCLAFDRVW